MEEKAAAQGAAGYSQGQQGSQDGAASQKPKGGSQRKGKVSHPRCPEGVKDGGMGAAIACDDTEAMGRRREGSVGKGGAASSSEWAEDNGRRGKGEGASPTLPGNFVST